MGGFDPLSGGLLLCFLVGLIFSVLSFMLGHVHLLSPGHDGHVHAPGYGDAHSHGHVGHAHAPATGNGQGQGHGHAHGQPIGKAMAHADPVHGSHAAHDQASGHTVSGVSPFNLSTLMAFLVGFGGIGYIAYGPLALSPLVALPMGFAAGIGLGALVHTVLTQLLLRDAERAYLTDADSMLVGAYATVTVGIPAGGIGEVCFSRRGARRSEGARHAAGQPIGRGVEVAIVGYERGIALVEPLRSTVSTDAAEPTDWPAMLQPESGGPPAGDPPPPATQTRPVAEQRQA